MEYVPIATTLRGDVQCLYQLGRCSGILGVGDLLGFCEELLNDRSLVDSFEETVARVPTWKTKHFHSVFDFRLIRLLIYALVRAVRPRLFVETGVLHGMTSAFILLALERNGSGALLSVDLPSFFETGPANQDGYHATLPPGEAPGWLIPSSLRQRWTLHPGASCDVLPTVLQPADSIDIFFHDSEHTYRTMWFELEFAWLHLREGGVLLCDNIDSNSSFFDFCRRVGRYPLVLPSPDEHCHDAVRMGIIVR